jgi:hypothetical protein
MLTASDFCVLKVYIVVDYSFVHIGVREVRNMKKAVSIALTLLLMLQVLPVGIYTVSAA